MFLNDALMTAYDDEVSNLRSSETKIVSHILVEVDRETPKDSALQRITENSTEARCW